MNRRLMTALALPPCLLMSACGGGGTDVASTPPPPPSPTPAPAPTFEVQKSWLTSPATRSGIYDVIGKLSLTSASGQTSSRFVAPGELTMSSSKYFSDDPFQYSLSGLGGILPGGLTGFIVNQPFLSWSFSTTPGASRNYANEPAGQYCCQYLGEQLTAFSKADDGSETKVLSYDLTRLSTSWQPDGTNNNLHVTLDYDIGYSYVAMGEWSWQVLDVNGNPSGESGSLLFANGDRTPASGIPASGTARYDAHTLADLAFALTADFGQRSISTEISKPSVFDVSGSAPFSNDGSFDIPLSGSAGAQPATGTMDGAFFGPHAEQVGGVVSVSDPGGILMEDAFVGQQQPH